MANPAGLHNRASRRLVPLVLATLVLALVAPTTTTLAARANVCETRSNATYQQALACMTLAGVREHQAALQAIADANPDEFYPDSRRAGTQGYSDSVDYVAGLLESAGYNVTLDPFDFTFVFPALLSSSRRSALPTRQGPTPAAAAATSPGR